MNYARAASLFSVSSTRVVKYLAATCLFYRPPVAISPFFAPPPHSPIADWLLLLLLLFSARESRRSRVSDPRGRDYFEEDRSALSDWLAAAAFDRRLIGAGRHLHTVDANEALQTLGFLGRSFGCRSRPVS